MIKSNKVKGFTLIELLTVIVILAVVALVATPIILTSVSNAKKSAARTSALGYVKAVDDYIGIHEIDEEKYPESLETGQYDVIGEDSETLYLNNIIKVTGDKPTSGWVRIGSKRVTQYSLIFNGYVVSKIIDNSGVATESVTKGETPQSSETQIASNSGDGNTDYSSVISYIEDLREDINGLQSDVNDLKTENTRLSNAKVNLPIGTIIESAEAMNPSDYFTGTWEEYTEAKGRTLVGIDTSSSYDWLKTVGQPYGEYEHTLSVEEMPSHDHDGRSYVCGYSGWTAKNPYYMGPSGFSYPNANSNCARVESAPVLPKGGGQSHNNVQPSITVYRYKRTS